MVFDMTRVVPDVLDAKRQMTRDNELLWRFVIGLRESDEMIEKSRRCCKESAELLNWLHNQKQ